MLSAQPQGCSFVHRFALCNFFRAQGRQQRSPPHRLAQHPGRSRQVVPPGVVRGRRNSPDRLHGLWARREAHKLYALEIRLPSKTQLPF
uniref:Uncharacterized protein n=1 Tax=Caenorhabditis japonica TaxID=281687 RepID=A0A8R1IFL4_CAEJA